MRILSHSNSHGNWNCNCNYYSAIIVTSSSVYSVVSMMMLLLLSVSSSINNQATTSVQAQAQAQAQEQRHQLRGAAVGDQRSLLVGSSAATATTATSSSTTPFSSRENKNKNKKNKKVSDPLPILVPIRESSSSLSSSSSILTSSNNTDDDDDYVDSDSDSDSDSEEDSCLVDTVCSIPELETLCGLMMSFSLPLPSTDEDNNNNNNNNNNSNSTTATGSNGFFFFNNDNTTTTTTTNTNINTFFAPNNDAFASLPQLVANDVTTNQDVFRNVLMYHAVVDDVDNNDIPITVNELVCNEELVMMNQETTKTVCRIIDDGDDDEKSKKIQLGVGNRPMRSLPTIIQGNIEACDGTIFIHIVNQVILPALPLSSSSSFSNTDTTINSISNEEEEEEKRTEKEEGTATINDGIDDNEDVNEDNEEQEKEEGTSIIDGRIDAGNGNHDEGEEKNHNGVNTNHCGGILETVCSLSGLETLCGSLQLLQNDNGSIDFLVKSGGTFFAPLNIAFARLPSQIVLDLQDSSILANVLEYHAVMKISSSTDALYTNTAIDTDTDPFDTNTPTDDTGSSSTLLFVDDLVCENELVMMNNKTTRTLCLARGDMKKIQVGFGNMPMRTLPNILPVRSDFVTCDRTGIIHLVDQVILPGLPLSGSSSFGSSSGIGGLIEIIPPPDENENENDTMESLPEEAMVEDTIDTSTTISIDDDKEDEDECPIGPFSSERCETLGVICEYEHVYTGCTWKTLHCTSTTTCECSNPFGSWDCVSIDTFSSCNDWFVVTDEGSNSIGGVGEGDGDVAGLPQWGDVCNPDDDLPEPPQEEEMGVVKTQPPNNRIDEQQQQSVCPANTPTLNDPCETVQIGGVVCEYQHVYTECTWSTLQCTPLSTCECSNDGTWVCFSDILIPCDNDNDSSIVGEVLPPWGEDCNPNNVLPGSPQPEEALVEPPKIIDESVVCPEVPTLNGPCETLGDVCEYQHVLMGCTWEELRCSPIVRCECDNNGTWGCFAFDQSMCGGGDIVGSDASSQQVAMSPSNDEGSNIVVPEGLPRGDTCRPNDELPTQKPPPSISPSDSSITGLEDIDVDTTTTTTTNRFDDVRDGKNIAGRGQLSTECPQFVNPAGPCSDTYVSNLVCSYDYIQLGCSWEELQCVPIMRCECNQYPFNDGNWACRTDSMMGCDTATTPPDFPWGKVCVPADDKWNN